MAPLLRLLCPVLAAVLGAALWMLLWTPLCCAWGCAVTNAVFQPSGLTTMLQQAASPSMLLPRGAAVCCVLCAVPALGLR